MNSEELRISIETARMKKGISQRELAKQTGISRSTLNDLINGKIKKVDIDDLRKIAEILDMSLLKLLKDAGYDEMLFYLSNDKYANKSTKDLKNIIEQYRQSEINLLNFDYAKRRKIRSARHTLFLTMEHLKLVKEKNHAYTIDDAINAIKHAFDELEDTERKYDYNKLPKQY